jgi:hypothetical protein
MRAATFFASAMATLAVGRNGSKAWRQRAPKTLGSKPGDYFIPRFAERRADYCESGKTPPCDPPFAACRYRTEITSANAGFTGMLRAQSVASTATKFRRESSEAQMRRRDLAGAINPSVKQVIRL